MTIVGLTGGLGAGKSTVASIAARLGAAVINADKLGHEVYAPGTPEHREVIEAFGSKVQADDGTINRRTLGEIVFADRSLLDRLNSIVWPGIRTKAQEAFERFREARSNDVLILEAAVLLEAGWEKLVDEVWVVTAAKKVRAQRTMQRDDVSESAALRQLRSQTAEHEHLAVADVVIENHGSIDELRNAVERELRRLRSQVS